MKILDTDVFYLEPEDSPRNSRFHMKIMMIRNIPNTKTGHHLRLECGHEVQTFGNLDHCGGVIFCTQCRDLEEEIKQ